MDERGITFIDGINGPVRVIKRTDIAKCPHVILVAAHYRDDGSCRCNDPNETIMAEWGYKWDGEKWIAGPDEEEEV